jgi:hypothetical protein
MVGDIVEFATSVVATSAGYGLDCRILPLIPKAWLRTAATKGERGAVVAATPFWAIVDVGGRYIHAFDDQIKVVGAVDLLADLSEDERNGAG